MVGGRSGDTARESKGRGVETSRKLDAGPFAFAANRLELDVPLKGLPTPLVNDARGRPDVCVAKTPNVLLQKVDEPPFALKRSQKLERKSLRVRTRLRYGNGCSGRRFGRLALWTCWLGFGESFGR